MLKGAAQQFNQEKFARPPYRQYDTDAFLTEILPKKPKIRQTMITQEQALRFAQDWLSAFNAHDLDAILDHYAEDVEFYSPFIPLLKFNESGCIRSKPALRHYFQLGLQAYPLLHFTLHHVFVGIDSLVIYYTSVNGRLASEMFRLDESGQAQQVFCHYTMP